MSVYVFTGPTISADEAGRWLKAVYCPPASQGSIFQAACRHPRVIAIIDGRFESVPSVWHKEILWAMSEGIHVFGAASMGALRAAELSAFGMVGIGKIFQDYASGLLEDDDEVAVAHSDGEHGYSSASVAMVNIRATLQSARKMNVISLQSRQVLERIAKAMFYTDRSYDALLAQSSGLIPAQQHKAFQSWLPHGQIDQKREDAIAMLQAIDEFLQLNPSNKQVGFCFQNTAIWESVLRTRTAASERWQEQSSIQPVIEELQLSADLYRNTSRMALLRFLAVQESLKEGIEPSPKDLTAVASHFRCAHGLGEKSVFQQWLAQNSIDTEEFRRLMEDETCIHWIESIAENGIRAHLFDQLRLDGKYQALAARAHEKSELLQSRGLYNPTLADASLTEDELLQWYCDLQKHPLPDDLQRFMADRGFEDFLQFKRALLREYCFRRLLANGG